MEYTFLGMKLNDLKLTLLAQPNAALVFVLPDGSPVPAQYHVTEVGHVAKRFIDCGGTVRQSDTLQLQLWLGPDAEHRLSSAKLTKIINLAGGIVPSDDLEVEVEYERESISQYRIASATVEGSSIVLALEGKHTDCLAKEVCGCAPSEPAPARSDCGCAPGACCA